MKKLVIVTVFGGLMLGLPASAAATTCSAAPPTTTTLGLNEMWLDLETGDVFDGQGGDFPSSDAYDLTLTGGGWDPPVAVSPTSLLVEAASIDKPFDDVTYGDIAGLTFSTGGGFFNEVVVLETAEGNYFKIGLVSVNWNSYSATIEWQQLVSTASVLQCEHAEIMEQIATLNDGQADIAQQISALNEKADALDAKLDAIDDLSQRVDEIDAKLDTLIGLIQNLPINHGSAQSSGR